MSTMAKADHEKTYGIDPDTWVALKYSIYPGCREESIVNAYRYCQSRNLDVMKKPVHIVPTKVPVRDMNGNLVYDRNGNREETYQDVLMPGINEYRVTASQTGMFAGQDEPQFGPVMKKYGRDVPEWCKVTVYRFVNGQKCAFTHIEFFEEACGLKNIYSNSPELNLVWFRRPRGQLAKCAEAGALRKAFPGEIGGVVTAEEMSADAEVSVEAMTVGAASKSSDTAESATVYLSDYQIAELKKAINKAGSLNPETILTAYRVERFEELRADEFDSIMGRIDEWIKKRDALGSIKSETQAEAQPNDQNGKSIKPSSSGNNLPPVYVQEGPPAWGEASATQDGSRQNTGKKNTVADDDDEIIYQ